MLTHRYAYGRVQAEKRMKEIAQRDKEEKERRERDAVELRKRREQEKLKREDEAQKVPPPIQRALYGPAEAQAAVLELMAWSLRFAEGRSRPSDQTFLLCFDDPQPSLDVQIILHQTLLQADRLSRRSHPRRAPRSQAETVHGRARHSSVHLLLRRRCSLRWSQQKGELVVVGRAQVEAQDRRKGRVESCRKQRGAGQADGCGGDAGVEHKQEGHEDDRRD
jgi:hypothetical protein